MAPVGVTPQIPFRNNSILGVVVGINCLNVLKCCPQQIPKNCNKTHAFTQTCIGAVWVKYCENVSGINEAHTHVCFPKWSLLIGKAMYVPCMFVSHYTHTRAGGTSLTVCPLSAHVLASEETLMRQLIPTVIVIARSKLQTLSPLPPLVCFLPSHCVSAESLIYVFLPD